MLHWFVGGIYTRTRQHDVDYSYYLGPDYKKTMKEVKHVSTLVTNHVSWCDVMILLGGRYTPAFAAKKSLKKVPLFGLVC